MRRADSHCADKRLTGIENSRSLSFGVLGIGAAEIDHAGLRRDIDQSTPESAWPTELAPGHFSNRCRLHQLWTLRFSLAV